MIVFGWGEKYERKRANKRNIKQSARFIKICYEMFKIIVRDYLAMDSQLLRLQFGNLFHGNMRELSRVEWFCINFYLPSFRLIKVHYSPTSASLIEGINNPQTRYISPLKMHDATPTRTPSFFMKLRFEFILRTLFNNIECFMISDFFWALIGKERNYFSLHAVVKRLVNVKDRESIKSSTQKMFFVKQWTPLKA